MIEHQDTNLSGERTRFPFVLRVTLVYGLLTLLITYPVPLRLASHIAGGRPFDAMQYTWSFWWANKAAFGLHANPAHVTWIHHPEGVYFPFLLAIPYIYLVGLPLATVIPAPAVYNLELLSTFVLSGLAAYFLCLELTRERRAAFIGGAIYAFFPSRIAHAAAGHLPHVTTYWFPLYALFLMRTVRRPTRRHAILCGLSLGVGLLVHVMHIPYLLVPLTLVYLCYEFAVLRRQWPDRRTAGALALAFLVGAAIALPWFAPLMVSTLRGETAYMRSGGDVAFSADLLAFVAPSPYNPVLQRLGLVPAFAKNVIPHSLVLYESLGYLGVVPLALGLWGSVKRLREGGSWAILALGAAILSLGPLLHLNGALVTLTISKYQTHFPLPHILTDRIPVMQWGRTPNRLNATVALALAVLAAYGLAELLKRVPKREAWAVTLLLGVLIMVEFIPLWPFPTIPTSAPAYLTQMAQADSHHGVLNLPMTHRYVNHRALFYQTLHHHPIVGGYVHRELPGIAGLVEFLEDITLAPPQADVIPRHSPETIGAVLDAYDVGHVLLVEDLLAQNEIEVRNFLSLALGPPVAAEQNVSIFQVPAGSGEVGDLVYGLNRESWYAVEQQDGTPERWMSAQAELYIYAPDEQRGRLCFQALPMSGWQRLQVQVNATTLSPLVIGDWMTYTTPVFTLQPGLNNITLRALDGCTSFVGDPRCTGPARAAGAGCNAYLDQEHCLSVLWRNIRFAPGDSGPAQHPLEVTLGDRVRFLGYDLAGVPTPGQRLSLTLYWQSLVPLEEDYTIFVHLLDADGNLAAQHDAPPLGRLYPTSAWVAGDIFTHQAVLQLPAHLPGGEHDLLVGLYTFPDLVRLPVAGDRPHAPDGLIWLQSVEINAGQ